jgi:peptidoglycan/xylan/chitin deacetylase (PgdA/CDA1 family)
MYQPPVIVNYHGIGEVEPQRDPLLLYVPPVRLRRRVRRLLARGYEFVTMADFARRMRDERRMRGICALTFDDGTQDHATVLPGLLRSLGVPGTVYVCPDLLGEVYWATAGVRIMTRDELLALGRDASIEIGSHTNEHTELHEADEETAYAEMCSSKRALEGMLDREVTSFAYPNCHYSKACPVAAERAGYASAATCGPRGSWSPFELRREAPDGPLTFPLKSRALYYRLRDLPPGRLVSWATRPYRHRRERDG